MAVTDAETLSAMETAFRTPKLVLEPAGAASIAGLLRHRDQFAGQTVAVIFAGDNVDPEVFCKALQG